MNQARFQQKHPDQAITTIASDSLIDTASILQESSQIRHHRWVQEGKAWQELPQESTIDRPDEGSQKE